MGIPLERKCEVEFALSFACGCPPNSAQALMQQAQAAINNVAPQAQEVAHG